MLATLVLVRAGTEEKSRRRNMAEEVVVVVEVVNEQGRDGCAL
jgi:hypothetical protein